jgi:hypothetical protein
MMGRSVLSPYLDLSVTHDSNAGVSGGTRSLNALEEESDQFLEYRIGVTVAHLRERGTVNADAWYYDRMYKELTGLDEDGYGETVSATALIGEDLTLSAYQRFERLTDSTRSATQTPGLNPLTPEQDLTEDAFERSERDVIAFGAVAGFGLGEKIDNQLSYQYQQTEYTDDDAERDDLDPDALEPADEAPVTRRNRLLGTKAHTFGGEVAYAATDKSAVFTRGTYGLTDNDGYSETGNQYTLLGGLKSRASAKLTYNIGVGYQRFQKDAEPPDPEFPDREPPGELDEDGLSYDAAIVWTATEKTAVSLSGNSEFQTSSFSTNNVRDVNRAQLGISHRYSANVSLRAALTYRIEDYSEPITIPAEDPDTEPLQIAEERETVGGVFSIAYAPPAAWYNLYANASYEDTSSNIPNLAYDQLRITAGLRVRY